jgi:hypothetical protein
MSTSKKSAHVVKETCKGLFDVPQTVYIVYAPIMGSMAQVGVYDTRKEANCHLRAMSKANHLMIN